MNIQICDEYFTKHIASDEYFSYDEDIRRRALEPASTDLASCGAPDIADNSHELLKTALCEQTLFVLCRKNKYTENEKELVSESIDGVGSCHYTPSGCPAHISIRAYALVDTFFRVRNIRLTRG